LIAAAGVHDVPVHVVRSVGELRPQWLAGAAVVGLTAGISARPGLVGEIAAALSGLGPLAVAERRVVTAPWPTSVPAPIFAA
jgi:4-hydroxy-3-methylbut-2-en-1-yl diphosphate reductase